MPFSRFVTDRAEMHRTLYNGDDLWPKNVNLCARGRNALLDHDLGPGASADLGLFGPAWEAHLYAVAVDRNPRTPWLQSGRTRLVYSWPVVSTGLTRMLSAAHRLGVAAQRSDVWQRSGPLRDRLRFAAFLSLRSPALNRVARSVTKASPAQRLALRHAGAQWAARLKIALLERLAFSVTFLNPTVENRTLGDPASYRQLSTRMLPHTRAAGMLIRRFSAALNRAAKQRGIQFDAARYGAFHRRHLLASLGPDWRFGRVSIDQLRAIHARLARTRRRFEKTYGVGSFDRSATGGPPSGHTRRDRQRWRRAKGPALLLRRVLRALTRLELILHGKSTLGEPRHSKPGLGPHWTHSRRDYLLLAAEIKTVRRRIADLARRSFTASVRSRLLRLVKGGESSLAAGSFYFDTEHLLETTSGFTHVGMIKGLRAAGSGPLTLWMFDRVLGFHYAYPVAKLENSVPVQALVLSKRVTGSPRRYHWLRLRVPAVFRLGKGRISERATLVNLFAHVKQLLSTCPALTTTPGFYYAAISWITAHSSNRLVLGDLWAQRVHTSYGYRTLDPDRLTLLKGRALHIPVYRVPGARWTSACPPREK